MSLALDDVLDQRAEPSPMKRVSENFSEKQQSRRGRPRVLGKEYEEYMRGLGHFRCSSRRGNVNESYFFEAIGTLWNHHPMGMEAALEAYAWLGNPTTSDQKGRLKKTLLAELGRIKDPETIRAVALVICKLKPLATAGVQLIRRARLRRAPAADAYGLGHHLARCVDDYRAAHPEASYAMAAEALRDVLEGVHELMEAPAETTGAVPTGPRRATPHSASGGQAARQDDAVGSLVGLVAAGATRASVAPMGGV